ncbi:acylase ACY 1 [Purpureocillium lavendulum]|uniref:Acylase ACY 1 n=1 Tax=Purpureocillium lavendulum TaxID=1247861 RepID=A0AB34FUJ4_9HYPO|nr:acylase ACY 1 [Purpureocillium lavendulum]
MSILGWMLSQWSTLPYPDQNCNGRTIIITGGNSGLGLEAARHFVRLNAAKVILACRSVKRGDDAKRDIEASEKRNGVIEVWQLNLGSFQSVKDFAARAAKLERLDVLLNSASILVHDWVIVEGHETMVTVNVISTFLLTILLLPTLSRTAARHNVAPHVTIVSSNGAFMASFPERSADNVFSMLKINKNFTDRYNITKLLQLMLMRKLAAASDGDDGASGNNQGQHRRRIIINALHPGLCRTQLFRRSFWPLSWAVWLAFALFGRSPEMGSRTLLVAACAGSETHGRWMTDCKTQDWPLVVERDESNRVMDKVWGELAEILEGIEPGVREYSFYLPVDPHQHCEYDDYYSYQGEIALKRWMTDYPYYAKFSPD